MVFDECWVRRAGVSQTNFFERQEAWMGRDRFQDLIDANMDAIAAFEAQLLIDDLVEASEEKGLFSNLLSRIRCHSFGSSAASFRS